MPTKTTLWQRYKRHDKHWQFLKQLYNIQMGNGRRTWTSVLATVAMMMCVTKDQGPRTKKTHLKANSFCFSPRNSVRRRKTNQLTHEISAGGIRVRCASCKYGCVPLVVLTHNTGIKHPCTRWQNSIYEVECFWRWTKKFFLLSGTERCTDDRFLTIDTEIMRQ